MCCDTVVYCQPFESVPRTFYEIIEIINYTQHKRYCKQENDISLYALVLLRNDLRIIFLW